MLGAEVYLGAWRWSAWGAWSAWLCAHPLTIAQCLSSKGFYPAACALFVIRGPLIPGDVLFWGFLRLNWTVQFGSRQYSCQYCSLLPALQFMQSLVILGWKRACHLKNVIGVIIILICRFFESSGFEGVFESYRKCYFQTLNIFYNTDCSVLAYFSQLQDCRSDFLLCL